MRWTVDWVDEALELLSDIYLTAADRDEVTHAQHFIDEALSKTPEHCGKELKEGLHYWQVSPLRVYFEIHSQAQLVKVTWVIRSIP